MSCLFGHKWNRCTCEKCGCIRDKDHLWSGCYCKICNTKNPDISVHDWEFIESISCDSASYDAWYGSHSVSLTPQEDQDIYRCRICGLEKIDWNIWDGMGNDSSGSSLR